MNRKQFLVSSLFSLLASQVKSLNMASLGNIPQTDITLNICIGEAFTYYFDYSPYAVSAWAQIDGNAGWIDVLQDGDTNSALGITIDAQVASMTDTFTITILQDTSTGAEVAELTIKVNVLSACETASDVCCTNAEQIVWINRDGGLQNFYFEGVREFSIDQRGEEWIIDWQETERLTTAGKVKDGRIFSTKNITKTELNALDSLNYSIQAWHLSDSVYLPISISKGGYTKYNSRDKRFNASIRFTYSTPINIQTQ